MPHLDQWSFGIVLPSEYVAPEQGVQCLEGFVSGHPRFNDGDPITTSRVVEVTGDTVITRSGSVYTLGDPHPDYEEQFPNAKERLFQAAVERVSHD